MLRYSNINNETMSCYGNITTCIHYDAILVLTQSGVNWRNEMDSQAVNFVNGKTKPDGHNMVGEKQRSFKR